MIVVLKPGLSDAAIAALIDRLRAAGAEVEIVGERRALRMSGATGRALDVESMEGVEKVLPAPDAKEGTIPLAPDVLLRQAAMICIVLAALLLMAAFLPPGLSDP
ncbi:MAG: hypothetical protein ACYS47_05185, partial [Planctomycetota bacterium]